MNPSVEGSVDDRELLLVGIWKGAMTNKKLGELIFLDRRRALRHHVLAFLRFGERDDVADTFRSSHQHRESIESECDATVWRWPKAKGLQKKAKLGLLFGFVESEHFEDFGLDIGTMNTNRTAADFVSVEHEVIGLGSDLTGIGVEERKIGNFGAREGMVRRYPSTLVIAFELREIGDPKEVPLDLVAE